MIETTGKEQPASVEQPTSANLQRRRVWYLVAAILLIAIGLPARLTDWYPYFMTQYAGDALWATMIFLVMCFLFPRVTGWKLWAITLVGCYLVESSQIYQAEWIRRIRYLPGVGLILGYGFLWTDMIAYTIGVSLGYTIDRLLISLSARKTG